MRLPTAPPSTGCARPISTSLHPIPASSTPTCRTGSARSISIALAKDPKQRYQSVQEMLEIICAIFGVPVQQVPERLKPAAARRTTCHSGHAKRHAAGAMPRRRCRHALSNARRGTQYVPPAPGQRHPIYPSGARQRHPIRPAGPGAAQAYYQSNAGAYPTAGQGPTGTQFIPGRPACPGKPGKAPCLFQLRLRRLRRRLISPPLTRRKNRSARPGSGLRSAPWRSSSSCAASGWEPVCLS